MTSPLFDILQKYGERCFIEGYEGSDEAGISIEEAEQAITALLEAAIGEYESKRPGMTMAQLHDIAIRNTQRDDIRQKLGIPTELTK